MTSTTRMVKTSRVAWSGMSSPLTRLMMFVNDTGIVNEFSARLEHHHG